MSLDPVTGLLADWPPTGDEGLTAWSPASADGIDTVDVVIIGSGPGGSTAAEVLTQAGWSVVLLERGRNHLVQALEPFQMLGHYSNDELKFMHRYFLGPDPAIEPRTFRRFDYDGDHEFIGPVNDLPATVGGGGVHADGKLPRFRPDDIQPVSAHGPMPGAELVDWPLTYEDLEPFYDHAEKIIGVAGDNTDNPFAAPRKVAYPMPPGPDMAGVHPVAEVAREMGYHPYTAPTGANSQDYDGRPACRNCGHCAFFGCPIHAKGDPVAPLQKALKTGRLQLWPECFATKIVVNNGVATGVDYVDPLGEDRHLKARHVVLAGGGHESPRLALLSGLGGDAVGRYVQFHYQTIVTGAMPYDTYPLRGRSVTHVQDDAIVTDALAMQAAREAGLPWIRGGLVEYAAGGHPIMFSKAMGAGAHNPEVMRAGAISRKGWTFCMQGEDMPMPQNRIDLDPTVKDVRGYPVARVTWGPHQHELVASAHWGQRLGEILKRAGSEWTIAVSSPDPRGTFGGPISPISESKHVVGTMRMGTDPSASVTDAFGRLHDVPNVVVCDGSVLPTGAGYGPTLTLVALTLRAAHNLAGTTLS
jgi:choline dehydrogenase-like flavoprotein